jgi:hypothetical protein
VEIRPEYIKSGVLKQEPFRDKSVPAPFGRISQPGFDPKSIKGQTGGRNQNAS